MFTYEENETVVFDMVIGDRQFELFENDYTERVRKLITRFKVEE